MKLKKNIGIRTQVFIGFGIFTAIIVCLLWIFQITMLNTFYSFIKENEIKRTADSVISLIKNDSLTDNLVDHVKSTNIEVMVTDEKGVSIISASSMHSDFFQKMTIERCLKIMADTEKSGGEMLVKDKNPGRALGFSTLNDSQKNDSTDSGYGSDNEEDDTNDGKHQDSGKRKNYEDPLYIVYTKIAHHPDGEKRLIILKAAITPVDATVETLKVQLLCLTVVMLLLSAILALVISRKISKPIVSISESAKIMAAGDYTITFTEKGSCEIRELASTLNYASCELSKVEGLRRELIANVSHDLRTPLTMITGYSEVMRDIPGENTPENVQIIIDEANRLTQLVNDMLDISKMESGKMEIELSRISLTESIDNILLRYDKLNDYNFEFYHGDDVFVMADELKLSQVIYNLVNNAITYAGEDKTVTLRQTVTGSTVKIEIIDTGIGIPQDKLQDIWERYYKAEQSHKRASVGTGLGLSIVKKILDLHGGEYGVISEDGEGSTFWFTLTIAK